RQHALERRFGIPGGELQNLGPGWAAIGSHRRKGGIGGKEERAMRKTNHGSRLARAPGLVHLLELPPALAALVKCPAAVVQWLDVRERLKAAGEDLVADAHQAGRAVAPKRPGTIIGVRIGVKVFLGLDNWPKCGERPGGLCAGKDRGKKQQRYATRRG